MNWQNAMQHTAKFYIATKSFANPATWKQAPKTHNAVTHSVTQLAW